jgi:ElaB/YqjD/DUF883 family membrane-anchored ribosome-binding protein
MSDFPVPRSYRHRHPSKDAKIAGSLRLTDMSRSDFNQAGNKAQKAREDLAEKATSAVDSASSVAAQTISKVEEAGKQAWDLGAQAKDQAQEIAGQVSEQSGRALQAITRQVQAEPLLGIVVAGAIGYFLGVISHRR